MDKKNKEIKYLIKEKTASYLLAAFGLVAGLAWNEAVKSLIEYIFPMSQNTLLAKFVYALILTFLLVVISSYLAQMIKKEDKKT